MARTYATRSAPSANAVIGRPVTLDGKMNWRRPEVLTDRQHIGPLSRDVAHCREHFLVCLAEPDHDPALADEVGRSLVRPTKHFQRTRVPRLRPHARVKAFDRLDVVVQDLWSLRKDDIERRGIADEVRDQDLHRRTRRLRADLTDRRGKEGGSAIDQLVTIDASH